MPLTPAIQWPGDMSIIPGNFLVLLATPSGGKFEFILTVWNSESFESHWSFVEAGSMFESQDTRPPSTHSITIPCAGSAPVANFSVLEHPLYPGLYNLWLYASLPATSSFGTAVYPVHVCKYRVSLDSVSQQCSIQLRISKSLNLQHPHTFVGSAGILFSGNTSFFSGILPEHFMSSNQYGELNTTDFPHTILRICPYSGTVWYKMEQGRDSTLVVAYYQ